MRLLLKSWIATEVGKTTVSIEFLTLRHRMWKILHLLCAVNQQANKILPVNPNISVSDILLLSVLKINKGFIVTKSQKGAGLEATFCRVP